MSSWVADQLGVSRSFYSQIESERRPAPAALRAPLAEALQTSTAELWPEELVDLSGLGRRERRLVDALLAGVELPEEFWDAAERLLEDR